MMSVAVAVSAMLPPAAIPPVAALVIEGAIRLSSLPEYSMAVLVKSLPTVTLSASVARVVLVAAKMRAVGAPKVSEPAFRLKPRVVCTTPSAPRLTLPLRARVPVSDEILLSLDSVVPVMRKLLALLAKVPVLLTVVTS